MECHLLPRQRPMVRVTERRPECSMKGELVPSLGQQHCQHVQHHIPSVNQCPSDLEGLRRHWGKEMRVLGTEVRGTH